MHIQVMAENVIHVSGAEVDSDGRLGQKIA
jgi:hypothetical protein